MTHKSGNWRARVSWSCLFLLLGLCLGADAAVSPSEFKSPQNAQTITLPLPTRLVPSKAGFIGIQSEIDAQGRLHVVAVAPDSPALRAGVRRGDLIESVDGRPAATPEAFGNLIRSRPAGQSVKLSILRGEEAREFTIALSSLASAGRATTQPTSQPSRPRRGTSSRGPAIIKKDVLRLAVIGIEFQDVHYNPKIAATDWDAAFFSRDTYVEKDAVGQRVYGSVNDYYREISHGAMRVDGKVFDWVEVSKNRMEYYTPPATTTADQPAQARNATYDLPLLREALQAFSEREGADALKGFDGVVFLYAGSPPIRRTGTVYWPHTSQMMLEGRPMRYVVADEGGRRMTNISLLCHEIGHILGLPDLYGSRGPSDSAGNDITGVGGWCLMSIQAPNGRPQHMCAWSKERLGWIRPAIVDPSVRQRLVLGPIEDSKTECFKVPLKWDGSDYLLLENRRRTGFDASLPAEGLLIWHVVNNRPVLMEAHGLGGPRAPWVNVQNIPYPTPWNDSFTPYTRPSSTTEADDGIPVYVTEIHRLGDGRIAFSIGYGFD